MSTEELVKRVLNCSKVTGLSIAGIENAQLRHTDAGLSMSPLQSRHLLL